MYSLDEAFAQLLEAVREPQALNPAKSDPIFYFVYPPEMALSVKRNLPRWSVKMKEIGWDVVRISLSELFWKIIDRSGRFSEWLALEHEADRDQINEAIRDVLRENECFVKEVAEEAAVLRKGKIGFLTDCELLHPYVRTRAIENKLHDRLEAPIVIFYPGSRAGQYGLKFLDFYSEDGGYRSTILGGL
jgi:hypothetical protein